jgi:hypothetical protein
MEIEITLGEISRNLKSFIFTIIIYVEKKLITRTDHSINVDFYSADKLNELKNFISQFYLKIQNVNCFLTDCLKIGAGNESYDDNYFFILGVGNTRILIPCNTENLRSTICTGLNDLESRIELLTQENTL